MKKPLIGVLPLYDHEKASYWMLPGYMKGIEDAGGIPIILPLSTDEEIIERIAHTFDGFLFTGGHDINPAYYGEEVEEVTGEICSERDSMEKVLFQKVIELDKPAFGICRGLQLFNVLLGGTLYQDIPSQLKESTIIHKQNPPYTHPVHKVNITKDTLLYKTLQIDSLEVNSYHHQGIKKISEALIAAAVADDGLIEAVVMPNKKFVLAVQWHPEFSYKLDDYSFKLFLEFVGFCKKSTEILNV